MPREDRMWLLINTALTLGAAMVARKVVEVVWVATTGRNTPEDPGDPDLDRREALAFAAATGVAVGVARLLAARSASRYKRRHGGKLI